MEREELLEIADQVLEASVADQTEVMVAASDTALTRFANNTIHQNVAEQDVAVSVRAVVGKRIGVARGNELEPESLRTLAERATELARLSEENADFISLPSPQEAQEVPGPAEATINSTPEQRAEAVCAIIDVAAEKEFTAAGAYSVEHSGLAVANSLGVRAAFEGSQAHLRTVITAPDSTGFAEAYDRDASRLDPESLGRRAVEKAVASANPQELEPGEYTIILEEDAVADMVTFLGWYGFNALAYQEGRSFACERMGEKVCDESISIWDDGLDARGLPMPLDFEGVPKRKVPLIEEGVLVGLTWDSFTAGREDPPRQSTGHALPAPNSWGPLPWNLFIGTGDATVEEMIAGTARGLLVTRFHYTNMVHPTQTVITGMTRDGTFLIEDGQVVGGVKNLRFTQSVLEALSCVEAVGSSGRLLEDCWAPALKIGKFNFVSGTEF